MPPARIPIADRFWPKVNRRGPDDCWEWTGSRHWGYGRLSEGGKHSPILHAHRVAYEMLVGPIPAGLHIDHLCRNRGCVNPRHMEPVTPGENVLRGMSIAGICARRDHCGHGHAYTPENTHRDPRGHRRCRECMRRYNRERTTRHHGAAAAVCVQTTVRR